MNYQLPEFNLDEEARKKEQALRADLTAPEVKTILENLLGDKYSELLYDYSLEGEAKRRSCHFLVKALQKALAEQQELERDIALDEATLADPNVTWNGSEKTEWRHELASKRTFSREDAALKVASIEDAIKDLMGMDRNAASHR